MFTGLVQAVGTCQFAGPLRLRIDIDPSWTAADALQMGESVAVNGVCLTVVSMSLGSAEFDLSEETLARTALARLENGSRVNLERALRPMDRLGGHWVQGHVDGTGVLVSTREHMGSTVFCFEIPRDSARYLVDKGSICIDGVSLTVVAPQGNCFEVWVIPHTLVATNLSDLRPGSPVNLEYDIVAKYLERMGAPWLAKG